MESALSYSQAMAVTDVFELSAAVVKSCMAQSG